MTPAARLIPQMVITPACRGKQQQHPSLFLVVVVVVGGGGGGGAVVVSWYILPLSLAQNVQVYWVRRASICNKAPRANRVFIHLIKFIYLYT